MGKLDIVKMSILPNLTYRFSAITIKTIPASCFVDIDKLLLKFTWRVKKAKNRTVNNLQEENRVGELTLSEFKTYYNAIAIKTQDSVVLLNK